MCASWVFPIYPLQLCAFTWSLELQTVSPRSFSLSQSLKYLTRLQGWISCGHSLVWLDLQLKRRTVSHGPLSHNHGTSILKFWDFFSEDDKKTLPTFCSVKKKISWWSTHTVREQICKIYLLIHDGADELPDGRQRVVSGVEGHRLPGESDLEQEGDALDGSPWVGGAGGRLAAVGQPAAEGGGRAGRRRRGRRGCVLREDGEAPRGGRRQRRRRWAVVGWHWLLSVTSSRWEKGLAGERHPKQN